MATVATEEDRVQLVRDLQLLDVDPDPSFDALTDMAAAICDVPMSLVSLVEDTRQFFASRHGLEISETSREVSFCAHAIAASNHDDVFEVADTHLDDRFRENDLVTGDPCLRFYAGVPLRPLGDMSVGTLCVLDVSPYMLTDVQRNGLLRLAGIAEQLMRMRLLAQTEGTLLKRLEDSERYYQYLADHTTDVVVVHDSNHVRTYYSPNMPGFFGYTHAEIESFPPSHRMIDFSVLGDSAAGLTQENPSIYVRAQCRRKDGSQVDVGIELLAIYEEQSIVEYRSTVRDIGGLVAKEQQLEVANSELVASGIRRSHAVRAIAHDLAAPLAAIRLTTESVTDQMSPSPLRAQMDHLVDFATDAEALIGDLRLVNDPDGEEPTLTMVNQPIAPLVERSAKQLFGYQQSTAIALDLADVEAAVDGHAVTRIVNNLLTNAVAHNPLGTSIIARLRADADGVVLEVEDDGSGIPVVDRERILEPYVALSPTGSGLGLAITKALVGAHGGTVTIGGNESSGTTVTVTFPG